MQAGLYNTPIKILKLTVEKNAFNEVIESFNNSISTRARILNLSNNRESVNNETFFADTKQLTVHDYVDVNEFDHVLIKDKEYKILAIVDDIEHREKTINIVILNK